MLRQPIVEAGKALGAEVGASRHGEQWGRLDDATKLYRTAAPSSRIIGSEGPPGAKARATGELQAICG
jgi:hypothetical protein